MAPTATSQYHKCKYRFLRRDRAKNWVELIAAVFDVGLTQIILI